MASAPDRRRRPPAFGCRTGGTGPPTRERRRSRGQCPSTAPASPPARSPRQRRLEQGVPFRLDALQLRQKDLEPIQLTRLWPAYPGFGRRFGRFGPGLFAGTKAAQGAVAYVHAGFCFDSLSDIRDGEIRQMFPVSFKDGLDFGPPRRCRSLGRRLLAGQPKRRADGHARRALEQQRSPLGRRWRRGMPPRIIIEFSHSMSAKSSSTIPVGSAVTSSQYSLGDGGDQPGFGSRRSRPGNLPSMSLSKMGLKLERIAERAAAEAVICAKTAPGCARRPRQASLRTQGEYTNELSKTPCGPAGDRSQRGRRGGEIAAADRGFRPSPYPRPHRAYREPLRIGIPLVPGRHRGLGRHVGIADHQR